MARSVKAIQQELDEAQDEHVSIYHELCMAQDRVDESKCHIDMLEEELARAKKEKADGSQS